jgi:lipopolysaccharide/colanic/teichoic acid biosynthesis glycosyltransferase
MIIKRLFDITFSLLGLIILLPIFILIAILIKSTSTGPILYRQVRVGRYGKEFLIYKFRTMFYNPHDTGLQITVGNDKRISNIGRVLRKTKLDELAQLFNVLGGSMSIVGPRPEVPKYVANYKPEIKDIVLSIRPGITDWASIKMIDENLLLAKAKNPEQLYIEEILPQKLMYAVRYVTTRSFFIDIVIIYITLGKIFYRKS